MALKVLYAAARVEDISRGIKIWTIEHHDFRDLMKRYDIEDAIFYLDTPYFGKKFYRHNLKESDFDDLAKILQTLKGK